MQPCRPVEPWWRQCMQPSTLVHVMRICISIWSLGSLVKDMDICISIWSLGSLVKPWWCCGLSCSTVVRVFVRKRVSRLNLHLSGSLGLVNTEFIPVLHQAALYTVLLLLEQRLQLAQLPCRTPTDTFGYFNQMYMIYLDILTRCI